jgi:hypothetical protein
MATFQIIQSRNIPESKPKRQSEFVVALLAGELVPGDIFRLYETHHFTDYTVRSINSQEEHFVIRCDPDLWYDSWQEGAVLDTSDLKSGLKFGFGGAGKHLYHPDALRAVAEDDTSSDKSG